MAVVIQEVVGNRHGDRFYPLLSGVARSFNYYPSGAAKPTDGVVNLALGLGRQIVGGGLSWVYSPAYPAAPPPFQSVGDRMRNTQTSFWAVNMGTPPRRTRCGKPNTWCRPIPGRAAEDGTARPPGFHLRSRFGPAAHGADRGGPGGPGFRSHPGRRDPRPERPVAPAVSPGRTHGRLSGRTRVRPGRGPVRSRRFPAVPAADAGHGHPGRAHPGRAGRTERPGGGRSRPTGPWATGSATTWPTSST